MRTILLAGGALLAIASAAQAADLPTKKEPAPAPKPNCFATFYTWLDSTPADCPLSYYGFTFYGAVDVGGGYATAASRFNKDNPNGIQDFIANTSKGSRFQPVPNGLGASNVGIKWKEQIAPGWYFIGDVNMGFDPYSLRFTDGPRSLEDNNNLPLAARTTNSDSSRAYGPINNRAYAGFSNSTFGTLTFGRQNSFADALTSAYDPFGGAYAFSLIGSSSSYVGGTGNTELTRYTDSAKYQFVYSNFRAGSMVTLGGYDGGNNAQFAYEGDIGGDWGGFSVDAIYQYAKDSVSLGVHTGAYPAGVGSNTLNATIENVNAGVIGAKYKFDPVPLTLYGGYEFASISAPSDLTPGLVRKFNDGFPGIEVANPFIVPRHLQVLWLGEKYGIMKGLDFDFGWYHAWQNNYNVNAAGVAPATPCAHNTTAAVAGDSPQGSNSGRCSGTYDVISAMLDYKPVKRVDLYGGVAYSVAAGGFANGYQKSVDIAPTVGVRVSF